MSMFMNKLLGLGYDILPWRKVPESDALCVVRGPLQRSQWDRQFTKCLCSRTATAKGASWTGSLLYPCSGTVTEQPAGQAVYSVSMFRDRQFIQYLFSVTAKGASWTGFLLCPCSGTVTEQSVGQGYSGSLLIVHVLGQAVY